MDPILTLFDTYRAAVWDKDIELFLSLYAEDFRGFDLWGDWSLDGPKALRTMVQNWFGGLAEDRDRVTFSDIRITRGQDMALAEAFVRFEAIAPDGTLLRGMDNRLTWGLRLGEAGWEIFHQHTSLPLGDDAAPQFGRPRDEAAQ